LKIGNDIRFEYFTNGNSFDRVDLTSRIPHHRVAFNFSGKTNGKMSEKYFDGNLQFLGAGETTEKGIITTLDIGETK
jgi:hypothetical protein